MENLPHFGFLSILPPVLAIILAIRTRQVFLSLIIGIWLGWMIIHQGNIWTGTLATIEGLVDVFQDKGSTRTILFSGLIGSLILFIQKSGGVKGFIHWLEKKLETTAGKNKQKSVQFLAWLVGVLIFVESNISVLTVGTLFRPIFDKLGISREKLAYIADSSSAPTCILFPFNAWGAFIVGLLITQGIERPFQLLIQAITYNFYAILALLTVPMVIFFRWNIGPMIAAEKRTAKGILLNPEAVPMMSDALTAPSIPPHIKPRAFNMIIPLLIMVFTMPLMLYYTGLQEMSSEYESSFLDTISNGSGSIAVLTAVTVALLTAMILYKVQNYFRIREMADLALEGVAEMIPLATLMLLAFAIGNVSRELHTGTYLAELTSGWLSPGFLPLLMFLSSSFIAFSTGTSWGTFGIMMAIAIPMAESLNAPLVPAIAAVMGGGIFGDHCSPISDTTIISSMASATDHIDHVRTQLPYALIIGGASALFYLILGIL